MQLLIASILLSLVSCCKRNDLVRINNYEFHSLYSFGKELKICSDVDVVHNIIESKKIKGPVIGKDVMTLILVNKKESEDTLKVIIYGKSLVKTEDIHPPKTGISVHFCVLSLMAMQK